ncbi:hypothetical protein ACFWY9_11045 [Amycolatopsis sp. NPDC059027]|uniref:hypothetical protein n=1 Tax=Amycolatopsis sp. NPDC059027 TaxID=3346709 RepID=UPI003670EBD1
MSRRIRWTLAGAGISGLVLTSGLFVTAGAHPVADPPPPRPSPVASKSSAPPSTSAPSSTQATTSTAPPPSPDEIATAVTNAVKAASPGTEVGFVIRDRDTGRTLAASGADQPYYTASVVKLLIALDVAHSGGWHVPDAATVADLTDMLAGSNDAIASQLWEEDGGGDIVTRMAELIGLTATTPADDPGQWGMARTSPDDVARVYDYLEDTVPHDVAQPVLTALAGARPTADDGYQQYFGIPDGLPGSSWLVKQGWMILDSSLVLNTTGVVDGRYVVALLTEQPAGTADATARAALTAGIAAAAPAFTAPTPSN